MSIMHGNRAHCPSVFKSVGIAYTSCWTFNTLFTNHLHDNKTCMAVERFYGFR